MNATKKFFREWITERRDEFTPTEMDSILKAFSSPRKSSFRINRFKTKSFEKNTLVNEIQQELNLLKKKPPARLIPNPWNSDAFYISNSAVTIKHIASMQKLKSGFFHFQGLSSMIPPLCLDIQKSHLVLDMCAAPGGKTLQIASNLMGGTGKVYGIELDHKRFQRLEMNIEKLVPIEYRHLIQSLKKDSKKITSGLFENLLFDRILLDAPCSGEGTFSIDSPGVYRHWSLETVNKYSKLQRDLFTNAMSLLKPGGQIVYSTCTLGPKENEENVQWFIDNFDVSIMDLGLDLLDPQVNGGASNFLPGSTAFGSVDLSKCLRVLPTNEYEGFFICRLQKN